MSRLHIGGKSNSIHELIPTYVSSLTDVVQKLANGRRSLAPPQNVPPYTRYKILGT